MASILFTAGVALIGIVVTASVTYLLTLLGFALTAPASAEARRADTTAPPPAGACPSDAVSIHFAVVVPAHDEEAVLATVLKSLARQDYPCSDYEVVVIADNCRDATAALGRTHGATVLERHDPANRGKGHALNWGLSHLLSRPRPPDAFIVIDADSLVAPDFLRRINARLVRDMDARGLCALQGRYGVLNADQGWRAALMAAAFALANHIRPLGREQMGLSAGLKGNGMAFTRAVVECARWSGDSITEDLEYGFRLVRSHGLRVGYVPEARVWAQMPTGPRQAAPQRRRWESGRYGLTRRGALPLLWEGLRRRSLLRCDAACDLLLPPLAELGLLLSLWCVLIMVGRAAHLLPWPQAWAATAASCALGLGAYVLVGLRAAGAPAAVYAALLSAPLYVVWKVCLCGASLIRCWCAGRKGARWERTPRTSAAVPGTAGSAEPEEAATRIIAPVVRSGR